MTVGHRSEQARILPSRWDWEAFADHRWDEPDAAAADKRQHLGAPFPQGRAWRLTLMDIVSAHGVSPQRLCIEITEGVLMDVDRAQRMLAELVEFGLRISIDDFGTGFSSLSYLKRFPIHELKIARSFVDGISTDADDRAIASVIISLARQLGMSVVGEGIEMTGQHAELEAFGCHRGQGFLYAQPLAPDAFADWVLARTAKAADAKSIG